SDMILGDNARIFRLVGADGADGAYLKFTYDETRHSESGADDPILIIPRAVERLDYEFITDEAAADQDAAAPTDKKTPPGQEKKNPLVDLSSILFSGVGQSDVIHGESGDDFIHGMTGGDILYGDSEDDDIYGEIGNDWISGGTGDDAVLGDDGFIMTSRNGYAEPLYGIEPAAEELIKIKAADAIQETANPTGELKKTVDLEPFDMGLNDYISDGYGDESISDDVIYGGLGDDALHGGAGNDSMSGAEALPIFYNNPGATPRIELNEDGRIVAGHSTISTNNGVVTVSMEAMLDFYDKTNALAKLENHYLNFDGTIGIDNRGDGEDVLFGDLGHDWLVGGSGNDHLYGGMGNDIHNADDFLETNDGLNNDPDTPETTPYDRADIVYGGGGRDLLIANTGADRMMDWAGEFNSYVVPFAPFGNFTVMRMIAPMAPEFLYALSESDGADQTRSHLSTDGRNGEPYGELGLVLQKDEFWKDQTGAPADKQPGNTPGGKKDEFGEGKQGGNDDSESTQVPDNSSSQDDVLVFDEDTNDLVPSNGTDNNGNGSEKEDKKDKDNNGNESDQSDDMTPPGQEKEKENNGNESGQS
ncbi:MAG: calcium-binding protein, partial [Candidatus Hinthialibacter sp.]